MWKENHPIKTLNWKLFSVSANQILPILSESVQYSDRVKVFITNLYQIFGRKRLK